MKFWLLDYNQDGRYKRRPRDLSGSFIASRIVPKRATEMESKIYRTSINTQVSLRTKQTFNNCRRVLATFGGFFSFKSTVIGAKNIFFNGISFFSISGRRGWSFVSCDNYPWDAKKLNDKALRDIRRRPLRTTFGRIPKMPLFELNPLENDHEQKYNFAHPYLGHQGQLAFRGRLYRDAEAFKLIYDKNKLSPLVITRSPDFSNFSAGTSTLLCDLKQFEISSLFLRFGRSQISHEEVYFKNDFLSREYPDFAAEMNSLGAEHAARRVFDPASLSAGGNKHFSFSKRGYVFRTRTPFWFRRYYLEWARAFYVKKSFPSFTEHFRVAVLAAKRFATGRAVPPHTERKRLMSNYTHTGSWASALAAKAASSFFGGMSRIKNKRRLPTSFTYMTAGRSAYKMESSLANTFIFQRTLLNSIDSYAGLLSGFMPALTNYKPVRRHFVTARRNRSFKTDLAARWALPTRPLVGRRGRKKALMR